MVRLEFPVLQGAQSLSDGPTFSAFMPVVFVRWKVGQGEIVEFREIHLCALLVFGSNEIQKRADSTRFELATGKPALPFQGSR